MAAVIGRALREQRYDLIHVDGLHLGRFDRLFSELSPNSTTVFNWHNIESELLLRYSAEATFVRSLYAKLTAAKWARFEDRLLAGSGGHLVCSERERRLLASRAPHARIAVIENGVDVARFSAADCSSKHRFRLVFVGSMNYHANAAAAIRFAKEDWPDIRSRFPDLTLTLVGAKPTPDVTALGHLPGVEVTGTVPDVLPYYAESVAAVVPLTTGGGTRLKILEAMAARVPVISTEVGYEGLNATAGVHLLRAAHKSEWVDAVARLRTEPRLEKDLVAAGISLVERRYDWSVIGERLCETYLDWAAKLA